MLVYKVFAQKSLTISWNIKNNCECLSTKYTFTVLITHVYAMVTKLQSIIESNRKQEHD